MSIALNQPNPHYLKNFQTTVLSNAKILIPQLVIPGAFTGLLFGGLHAGISWSGIYTFEGTPSTTALFYGLMPAAAQVTQATTRKIAQKIFKNYMSDPKKDMSDPEKVVEQLKAQQSIALAIAGSCILPLNTVVYNVFATALELKQWDASDIFYKQFSLGLYYSALISGAGMMANTALKTVLTAKGLFEEKTQPPMPNSTEPAIPELTKTDETLILHNATPMTQAVSKAPTKLIAKEGTITETPSEQAIEEHNINFHNAVAGTNAG